MMNLIIACVNWVVVGWLIGLATGDESWRKDYKLVILIVLMITNIVPAIGNLSIVISKL